MNKDVLFVTQKMSDKKINYDVIYNSDGDIIYIPKQEERYNIIHSKDNDYIFEIRNTDDDSITYKHFRYNEEAKNIDLIKSIYNEKLENILLEKEDTFLLFEDERPNATKKELYSLKKGKFITPKVDNIERIIDKDNPYYIFEDIDYKPNLDRENHIYGIIDGNGDYMGYIYDYFFDRKYKCDIYEEPFFMKYYTLRMQIDRRFKDALLNELLEDEETKQLKR